MQLHEMDGKKAMSAGNYTQWNLSLVSLFIIVLKPLHLRLAKLSQWYFLTNCEDIIVYVSVYLRLSSWIYLSCHCHWKASGPPGIALLLCGGQGENVCYFVSLLSPALECWLKAPKAHSPSLFPSVLLSAVLVLLNQITSKVFTIQC